MSDIEVSVLGYIHVEENDEKEARRKAKKQGNIGHPQGVELVEESDGVFVFDLYSHVSFNQDDLEDDETPEEKAKEETGFNSRLCDVSIEECDVTRL